MNTSCLAAFYSRPLSLRERTVLTRIRPVAPGAR